jgi:hypothetical protein
MIFLKLGFPAALGAVLAMVGFDLTTWQFWAIYLLATGWAVTSGMEPGK